MRRCDGWNAARWSTCAVRRLTLLERSEVLDPCSPLLERSKVLTCAARWLSLLERSKVLTRAARWLSLLERSKVFDPCSPSVDVTLSYIDL